LVPAYVAKNLGVLRTEMEKGKNPNSKLGELASLYSKAGVDDYDWHRYGPDRNEMRWQYFSFDPPETRAWVPRGNRSRTISFPEGMNHWYTPDFDPSAFGWKTGLAPFGQIDGELQNSAHTNRYIGCHNPVCRCGDPMKTFWDKEVLMIHGRFTFPAMKEGYSYRILFGGKSHVGVGNGPIIYINGKSVANGNAAPKRGQGGRPRGALIPKSMMNVFQGKEVTISAICHLNMHHRTRQKHGFLTVWMEEMLNPPVTEELAFSGLRTIPMQSTDWQQKQDSDIAQLADNEGLFLYDGVFTANANIIGKWVALGRIDAIGDVRPDGETHSEMPRNRSITFRPQGFTDLPTHYWSGDILMEVAGGKSPAQALRMVTKRIEDQDYLFVEAGGFTFSHERQTYKHPRTWASPWHVYKRR
jgi:hypothetical protein